MLSEVRKGEIAFALLKSVIRDKGITALKLNSMRRQAGNTAKEVNMPEDEIFEFMQVIIGELISEAMGKKVQWGADLK